MIDAPWNVGGGGISVGALNDKLREFYGQQLLMEVREFNQRHIARNGLFIVADGINTFRVTTIGAGGGGGIG